MTRANDPDYPAWVCHCCGENYGTWYKRGTYVGPPHHYATYHQGTCGVCGATNVAVTEPRDYGHLRSEWRKELCKQPTQKPPR